MSKTIVPLVYDKQGNYIDGALCFTQIDPINGAFCVNGGKLIVPESLQNTQFSVSALGYNGYGQSINLGTDGDKQIRVGLAMDPSRPNDVILPGLDKCGVIIPPNPTPIQQIKVSGRGFETADNKPWHMLNVTGFKLFKNYIDGVDIEPFCRYASSLGNTVRVFFTCENEFQLYPSHYSMSDVISFYAELYKYNLHGEATAFADYGLVFGNNHQTALNFYNNLVGALELVENKFLELVNEHDVAQNEVPANTFGIPFGIISSAGSGGGDVDPVTPPWDYMGFHLGRNSEWPRKAKSAMEFEDEYNKPCINGETNRPDIANYVVSDFKDCGHVSSLLSAGTNGHSLSLKQAMIPVGEERDCVEAILKAASQVPAYVQTSGYYTRGTADGNTDCPIYHRDDIALRTFARIINNEAWAVIVRPTSNNPRSAVSGWRITDSWDNLFHLVRT